MEAGIADMNERLNNILSTADDDAVTGVFNQLKPYCVELLGLLQDPKRNNSTVLSDFLNLLKRTPSHVLQPVLDYALFPLMLVLDAAVSCRSPEKLSSDEKLGTPSVPNLPYVVGDSVAEGVVLCMEEILIKCQLVSVNQMVIVLKKLTHGALLSPSDASEEFRDAVIRCFRALLLSLDPCSLKSCPCNQIPDLATSIDIKISQIPTNACYKYKVERQECLLAFLQSENASAAIGHWISLLLKAADIEAARGHRGSAKLRIEAFLTLRVLIAKVRTADALAFFLPGVVSQFVKVLRVSKTMISGAAGSTEAINQALRGLSEFLVIVLGDKANVSSLDISLNESTGFHQRNDKSTQLFLDALRQLPVNGREASLGDSNKYPVLSRPNFEVKSNIDYANNIPSFRVNRTNEWINETSANVDKLLSAVFPHLCVHPAQRVRRGLVDAIRELLSNCSYTLKKSKLMLLECLCVLVSDDDGEVSLVAQEFLEYFFMFSDKNQAEQEVAEIFNRLIERLPKVVLGSEETHAVSHAQRLLAVMYYAGPRLVVNHLLRSPITAAHFLDALTQCLNHNSVFAGSLDKFILPRRFSAGYLHSIAELKAGANRAHEAIVNGVSSEIPRNKGFQDDTFLESLEVLHKGFELPRMPPWFIHVGSQKLYLALAGILRLIGLSTMTDSGGEVSLSTLIDIPLNHLRGLISEVRMREYSKESWQSWYTKSGSGQLLRQASTAVCILNEIIYGLSDQSVETYVNMFRKSRMKVGLVEVCEVGSHPSQPSNNSHMVLNEPVWKVYPGKDARFHLIDCIGSILHEYLSTEVWDLPVDQKVTGLENQAEHITLHFFRDTAMLHQVIIEGIGTFNICLGGDFASSGFLHSSLYLLLENLICSNSQIRMASDAVLHLMSASSGHPTVGCLVVANADYIIDSLCRQLRHLELNPHVPRVLAAMLSYVGVANDILPLLEEPMRSVSTELEILGRHQHPNLTVPFLKAVSEIVKASKYEVAAMPKQAQAYSMQVRSEFAAMEEKTTAEPGDFISYDASDTTNTMDLDDIHYNCNLVDTSLEHWEELMLKLNEFKRYRRIVGSVAGSCLTAATPLLASLKETICLVALGIIEDGIATLAKVEDAFRHEKEAKRGIQRAIQLCSFHDLQDTLDVDSEETDENRLLPAMNKIWPYLVVCIKGKNPAAVRRCLDVVSNVVQICGGDFFSRRFLTDGPHFWKLLTTSPFQKKPILGDEKAPLQLPYRTISSSDEPLAETSSLKVQAAALQMIANLSKNGKSASALQAVLKKVCGLVVGVACSGVVSLRDDSISALTGLACIDPDLTWLLLADVYYALKKKDLPSSPTLDFPEICQLLPTPSSPKEYLYAQYGGGSFGFGLDPSSVEIVFGKLNKLLNDQMYS